MAREGLEEEKRDRGSLEGKARRRVREWMDKAVRRAEITGISVSLASEWAISG